MPSGHHCRTLVKGALISAVLSVSAVASASAAQLAGRTPSVTVTVPGVISQAQLTQQLRDGGFSDIQLTPVKPNPASPVPQATPTSQARLQETPVHPGWNGTAMKDGQKVWVRVAYGATPSVAEMPR